MRSRLGHKMVFGCFAAMLFLLSANAQAVSLGKIEVTSHLGEPFYAEIPLSLDSNESIAKVYVEIASPTDYRILEVYRDPALNAVRADVTSDSRGARVELSSRSAMDAPFFNLVLKIRYQRATHFKKYPIFLDLPKAVMPKKAAPAPVVQAVRPSSPAAAATSPAAASAAAPAMQQPVAPTTGFVPYDGWARTGRYGPMVYGDTISTVAERLRVDDRFTRQQVMVALFEKNRSRFDQDNINLIKAGTFLDVPRAAEVERITPTRARNLIAEHEKAWKELKKQPRYAAVAEAQRTRYSKRVRIGKQASGVAEAPSAARPADESKAQQPSRAGQPASAGAAGQADGNAKEDGAPAADVATRLAALKQQNEELKARLAENAKQLEALKDRQAAPEAAAAKARADRLELKLARLQSELDAARARAVEEPQGGSNWLTWLFGVLTVVLLAVVGFLMRREPAHPAATTEPVTETAPAAPADDAIPEIDVEEADVEALQGGDTAQVTVEQEQAFTDSIPDLTDEDTGEMPAFKEDVEEEPDPNVDYLSEADVYMRYGMEDEALQQINLALRLKPDNAEAHIKKAELLQTKGETGAFEETVAEATQTLAGEDLERFKAAISSLQGDKARDEASLEDTLPPSNVSDLIGEEAAGKAEATDEHAVTEFEDLGFGEAEIDTSSGSDDTVVEKPSFDDTAELDAALLDLDSLDVGGDSAEAEAGETPAAAEEKPEAEETAASEASAPEAGLDDGGLDFDLSDIDLPDSGGQGDAGPEAEIETADLEKTVAMDWSRDTSVDTDDLDLMGESGAGDEAPAVEGPETGEASEDERQAEASDLDVSLGGDTIDTEVSEGGEPAAEEATTLDLGEGDLDDGFDIEEAEVEPADDFTSTIRTSLDKVAKEADDFTATGEHDLQFNLDAAEALDDSMLESLDDVPDIGEAGTSASDEDSAGITLDLEEDQEATQKLDDLLSEFTDEDEDKKE